MGVRFLNIAPCSGWNALFTTDEGEPFIIHVGGWATVEYFDDDDHTHCVHCGQAETFTEIEAVLPDSTGLTTIHIHSNPNVDYKHLVGFFTDAQMDTLSEEEIDEKCTDRLEWLAEQAEKARNEAGNKLAEVRHLKPVN
jgi:hypothetical protein